MTATAICLSQARVSLFLLPPETRAGLGEISEGCSQRPEPGIRHGGSAVSTSSGLRTKDGPWT